MTQTLIVNDQPFECPTNLTPAGWGTVTAAWMNAITYGVLQKTAGLFQLLAQLDLGPDYGITSILYNSRSADIGTSGIINLANTDGVAWRNSNNTADLVLVPSGNNLTFNGTNIINTGNVVIGPSTSTNGAIAVYGNGSGNLLLNTGITIDSSNDLMLVNNITGTGIATYPNIVGSNGTFSTSLTAPTVGSTDNSTNVATTAFVQEVVSLGIPSGCIFDFAGTAAPTGYLLCYGQSVGTATYPNLFAAIGYTYGGSGTSFTIPDYRGRIGAGKDNMGGTAAGNITAGTTIGTTLGSQSVTLTNTQLPAHTHTATSTDSGHVHGPEGTTGGFVTTTSAGGVNFSGANSAAVTSTTATGSANITTTIGTTGTGSAFSILQPTIIVNKIIKT